MVDFSKAFASCERTSSMNEGFLQCVVICWVLFPNHIRKYTAKASYRDMETSTYIDAGRYSFVHARWMLFKK